MHKVRYGKIRWAFGDTQHGEEAYSGTLSRGNFRRLHEKKVTFR